MNLSGRGDKDVQTVERHLAERQDGRVARCLGSRAHSPASQAERRTGLVTYVTAGDPDLTAIGGDHRGLDRAGADVLEIGVPFSDPLADGPVIQRATERALAAGATLDGVLGMLAGSARRRPAPIVIFSYANPILRMGLDDIRAPGGAGGRRGVLTLDMPPEEADEFRGALARAGIDTIFLLSPTTTVERIRRAAELGQRVPLRHLAPRRDRRARHVSRLGARGAGSAVGAETRLPLALGFGISRPEHVRASGVGRCRGRRQRAGQRDRRARAVGGICWTKWKRYVRWLKELKPRASWRLRDEIDKIDEVIVRLLDEPRAVRLHGRPVEAGAGARRSTSRRAKQR